MSFLLFSIILLASGCLATPAITALPLPGGCTAFPGYNKNTGEAYPLFAKITNSDNKTIEGFYNTHTVGVVDVALGKPAVGWSYLTFPINNGTEKTKLRCFNNTLQAYIRTSFNGTSFGLSWGELTFIGIPEQELMYYPPQAEAAPIRPFAHYINGVKQEGVFLGGFQNSTSWGIKHFSTKEIPTYESNTFSDVFEYFIPRLLGPKSADSLTGKPLFEREFTAFIQVVQA